jgi:DnaJ like chaperone protein
MAQKFVKWVGGVVGWALGGPIGAVVGYGLGYLWDNASLEVENQVDRSQKNTREGDFNISLLVLAAAIMKADNRILKSELDYVKRFLRSNYGEKKSLDLLKLLKDILEKNIDIRGVCYQIKGHMNHAQRLQLVHFLIGIAKADGNIDSSEVQMLRAIASYLNVSIQDFSSMDAMYAKQPSREDYFKVLELSSNANEQEIKSAYRKMAKKYHPDRLGEVGEEVKEAALEKFRKVQEAYEFLSKQMK